MSISPLAWQIETSLLRYGRQGQQHRTSSTVAGGGKDDRVHGMHRHVEAERFHVRLSPGAASFLGKTLRHTLIRSERTDFKLAELVCIFLTRGKTPANNDRNARPPRSLIDLYDLWRLNVERGDAFAG